MNIAIVGRTEMLLNSAKKLHAEGYNINAIITCKSESFYKAKESDFEQFANEIGAKYFYGLKVSEFMSELKGLDCEIAFSEMEVFADAAISMNNSNAVCFIKKRFISAI